MYFGPKKLMDVDFQRFLFMFNAETVVSIACIRDDENVVWFKSSEIAIFLGQNQWTSFYRKDNIKVYSELDINEKSSRIEPNTTFINRSGLFEMLATIKNDKAISFLLWLSKTILPSLEKTRKNISKSENFQNIDTIMISYLEKKFVKYFEKIENSLNDLHTNQRELQISLNELQIGQNALEISLGNKFEQIDGNFETIKNNVNVLNKSLDKKIHDDDKIIGEHYYHYYWVFFCFIFGFIFLLHQRLYC